MSALARVGGRGAIGLVLSVALTGSGGCDAITGAGGYATTADCTGPSCAQECAAQGGVYGAGTCTCAGGAPLCGGSGGSCCGGTAPHCVTTEMGGHRCSVCTEAAYECGRVCCERQTCLNAAVGACGTAYGRVARSCEAGLDCPVATSSGATEHADCCESIPVSGGTFPMGLSAHGNNRCPSVFSADPSCSLSSDETPQHDVTLVPFTLDRFEVTVGRFRAFVEGWDYRGLPEGAGGDPVVAGAGWQSTWNGSLPGTRAALEADIGCLTLTTGPLPETATWTTERAGRENFPINCVSWYEAFAFCAWDGGRLPTEAEWEYAAANGPRGDLFPWGEELPTASLAGFCPDSVVRCHEVPLAVPPAAVGSRPSGKNRYGHLDLAGNMSEWVLDTWAPYPADEVTNYADVSTAGVRVTRGGSFTDPASYLRAAYRGASSPAIISPASGFRCARRR